MSKFLGPIHYWLYNKIGNQEKLTSAIAKYAESKQLIASADPYLKELPSLEAVVDESNIHGWLQAQISDAEIRYAQLIVALECADGVNFDEVLDVAFEFGKGHKVSGDTDAMSVYEAFENFFVNGMPCDRVNVIVAQKTDELSWEMTQDIHAEYWKNGNCTTYYRIRKAVMDGMLAESSFKVIMDGPYRYSIQMS